MTPKTIRCTRITTAIIALLVLLPAWSRAEDLSDRSYTLELSNLEQKLEGEITGDSLESAATTIDEFATLQAALSSDKAAKTESKMIAESTAATRKTTVSKIAEEPVGNTAGNVMGISPSILDALSLLGLSVDSDTAADDRRAFTANFNLSKIFGGGMGRFHFATTFMKSEVHEKLVEKIPESVREEVVTRLRKDELSNTSDIVFSMTYNHLKPAKDWDTEGNLWGREYKLYENMANQLLEELGKKKTEPLRTAWIAEVSRETERMARETKQALQLKAFDIHALQKQLNSLSRIEIDELTATLTDTSGLKKLDEQLHGALKATLEEASGKNAEILKNLINNQPQGTIEVSVSNRDELVGPSWASVKLTYGHGFNNFNTLKRYYAHSTASDAEARRSEAWEKVTKDNDYAHQLRLTASISYRQTDELSLARDYGPIEGEESPIASYFFPKVRELSFNGTLSAKVPLTNDTVGRAELSLEFIDVDGDPDRQDRLVFKVGYTLPMADKLQLPITLTYANKPEFLGEQDHKVSAHVGLSFRVGKKE